MIDVSDGLAADLHHLADASGVGLDLTGVPVHRGATEDEALHGGEDYVLAMAVPDRARVEAVFAERGLARPLPIGVCLPDASRRRLRGTALERHGWEHTFGAPAG